MLPLVELFLLPSIQVTGMVSPTCYPCVHSSENLRVTVCSNFTSILEIQSQKLIYKLMPPKLWN